MHFRGLNALRRQCKARNKDKAPHIVQDRHLSSLALASLPLVVCFHSNVVSLNSQNPKNGNGTLSRAASVPTVYYLSQAFGGATASRGFLVVLVVLSCPNLRQNFIVNFNLILIYRSSLFRKTPGQQLIVKASIFPLRAMCRDVSTGRV